MDAIDSASDGNNSIYTQMRNKRSRAEHYDANYIRKNRRVQIFL